MLNACSKEAPRVRKCYKPILHLRFRLGPRRTAGFLTAVRRPPGRSVLTLTPTSGHDVTL